MSMNLWSRKELRAFLNRVIAQLEDPEANDEADIVAECEMRLRELNAQELQDGDECPNCQNGTVGYEDGHVVCRGECGHDFGLTPLRRAIHALDPRLGVFIIMHHHRHGDDVKLVLSDADAMDKDTAVSLLETVFEPAREEWVEVFGPEKLRHMSKGFSGATRRVQAVSVCVRCGSNLDAEAYCVDETCPFHRLDQADPTGWEGHPQGVPNQSKK